MWGNVQREDVIKAIKLFKRTSNEYAKSKNTFLIYKDEELPAKHIRYLSYQIANNETLSKDLFSGGIETVDFFNQRGFSVKYKNKIYFPKNKSKIIKKSNSSAKDEINIHGINNTNVKIQKLDPVKQKNALQKLLQQIDILETEKKFPWMRTPDFNNLPDEYKKISNCLYGYRKQGGFKKSNYSLLCDFVLDNLKIIIEYDENQHFSKAREITLKNYPENIKTFYNTADWIKNCNKLQAIDNNPVDRDERRAFYDCVRDIESFNNNYRLFRIMHGAYDWEAPDALDKLKLIISSHLATNHYSIGRLIITKKYINKKNQTIDFVNAIECFDKFIKDSISNSNTYDFILSPGGFLRFNWPKKYINFISEENHPAAIRQLISLADVELSKFIKIILKKYDIKNITDYISIGIDSNNYSNKQNIELVALYDVKKSKIVNWTGKFYPTEEQRETLIRIDDLQSHFYQTNKYKVMILGCHDLSAFNPRGQANANPAGWKSKTSNKFIKLARNYKPNLVLQHPHYTDSSNIWNLSWKTLIKQIPTVKTYASGITYYRKQGLRQTINQVIEKTKMGTVYDYVCN